MRWDEKVAANCRCFAAPAAISRQVGGKLGIYMDGGDVFFEL